MSTAQVIENRLNEIRHLKAGAHEPNSEGAWCAMEAVAYVAGEPWSDRPQCACPVIAAFMRSWNDSLPDDERDAILLPLIPKLVGTRRDKATEERRALMAAECAGASAYAGVVASCRTHSTSRDVGSASRDHINGASAEH